MAPASKAGRLQKLLELQEQTREKLSRLRNEIASLEGELNELVYRLYGVTAEEEKAIEGFLDRYSSQSAGETAEAELPPQY